MAKNNEIIVKDVSIKTMTINGVDYICITDIARQKNATEPKDVVKNWMRQKNTLEYLVKENSHGSRGSRTSA